MLENKLYVIWLIIFLLFGCKRPAGLSLREGKVEPALIQPARDKYYLQIGDILEIKFFNNPELNERVTVRPDGKISLQLVDDIQAAGLEPRELDKILTEKYAKEIRQPAISVIVKRFAGYMVYVGGQVNEPKLVRLKGNVTVSQAIFEAKGFKDTSNWETVLVIRRGVNHKPVGLLVNMEDILEEGDYKQDIPLLPYDIVYVPTSTIADIDLAVDQYFRKLIPVLPGWGFAFSIE